MKKCKCIHCKCKEKMQNTPLCHECAKGRCPRRQRIGCDYCKEDGATQKFEGYCGDDLWICSACFNKLIRKLKK